MTQWLEWLAHNWILIVVPLLAFLAVYVIGLLLRIILFRLLNNSPDWNKWRGSKAVSDSIRRPIMDWFILLGAYVGTQSSVLSPDAKNLASRIIGSFFIISLAWVADTITEKLIRLYASARTPKRPDYYLY